MKIDSVDTGKPCQHRETGDTYVTTTGSNGQANGNSYSTVELAPRVHETTADVKIRPAVLFCLLSRCPIRGQLYKNEWDEQTVDRGMPLG
jgi:hypothetical protein